jgi:hypothetical protein
MRCHGTCAQADTREVTICNPYDSSDATTVVLWGMEASACIMLGGLLDKARTVPPCACWGLCVLGGLAGLSARAPPKGPRTPAANTMGGVQSARGARRHGDAWRRRSALHLCRPRA